MGAPLRVLIVEDSAADAELMVYELRVAGYEPAWARVETEAEYLAHLEPAPDIILADYRLPQFGAPRALGLLRERCPEVPLIVISGAIGEDVAVATMRQGASDYLLKDRLGRLGQAVSNALEQTQLRNRQRQADSANRAKTEFLSRMSHELRTPLTAILGFADILEMAELEAKQRECVQIIMRAGRHLRDLIDDLLDISRIEAGGLRLLVEPVAIDDVIRQVSELMLPQAAARHVTLMTEPTPPEARLVLADRQRLRQVLLNLLSNAVKYNREHGTVTVSAQQDRETLRLAVTDTGLGIRPEDVDRLFQPFERLGAEKTEVEGTGLGLALSKSLVTAMGGTLGVSSRLGEGTTFWLELRSAEGEQTGHLHGTAELWSAAIESATRIRRTALYVEDNIENVRLMEHILGWRPGVTLMPAMQGSLALQLARDHHPDLIILDLRLPDMGGDEVLSRLRADDRTMDIPVVVISADASRGEIDRLLGAGAHAYFTKPFDVRQFLATIDEVFAGSVSKLSPSPTSS